MDLPAALGRALMAAEGSGTMRAQELLGRKVYDAEGKDLGRVFDLAAEREGYSLVVKSLVVGHAAWRSRFGWSTTEHGSEIAWELVASLEPDIRLRAGTG